MTSILKTTVFGWDPLSWKFAFYLFHVFFAVVTYRETSCFIKVYKSWSTAKLVPRLQDCSGFFAGTSFWKKPFRTTSVSSRPTWPSSTRRTVLSTILCLRCSTGEALLAVQIDSSGIDVCSRLKFLCHYRLKELNETHRKVEHEIKIAVFTLINEINKKGKSLLQQLEVRPPPTPVVSLFLWFCSLTAWIFDS